MRFLLDGLFGVAASGLCWVLVLSCEEGRVRYPFVGFLCGALLIGLFAYAWAGVSK